MFPCIPILHTVYKSTTVNPKTILAAGFVQASNQRLLTRHFIMIKKIANIWDLKAAFLWWNWSTFEMLSCTIKLWEEFRLLAWLRILQFKWWNCILSCPNLPCSVLFGSVLVYVCIFIYMCVYLCVYICVCVSSNYLIRLAKNHFII